MKILAICGIVVLIVAMMLVLTDDKAMEYKDPDFFDE
jgi:hypothetical protein